MMDKTNAGKTVELVSTNDPHTELRPGDKGVIRWERFDGFSNTVAVDWENGSTLTLLDNDRYRILP